MKRKRKKKTLKKAFVTLFSLLLAGVITYNAAISFYKITYPKKYSDLIEQNAKSFSIEPSLLYALIKTESDFDPNALSPVGAMGLTQIMPETFSWLLTKTGESYETDALYNPEISVYYGAWLLNYLLDEFGDEKTALAAYHAGRGIVNKWLSDSEFSKDGKTLFEIPYGDTKSYTERVLKIKNIYINLYERK